ncbi:MAG TPA: nucleotidyltransferase domain-containing protein [Nanoarchaeota archaeon]|nr:nucleotidyltransferase domain-containing protein [Nanoarchaeota archaeon]HIH62693.1 nucleotidyltransferase domain-containing protein [Nanoarchaeota archaeon]HIJ09899.1 nucleotidyltransferase domain-containing protein [Nanoarchaeota archaeon]
MDFKMKEEFKQWLQMAKEDSNEKLLKDFKDKLSNHIPITKMLLFGSRARRDENKWSDFDLIIVSDNFQNKDTLHRPFELYDYWDLDYPVDFICYTPKEYNKLKNKMAILKNALKEGIEIK